MMVRISSLQTVRHLREWIGIVSSGLPAKFPSILDGCSIGRRLLGLHGGGSLSGDAVHQLDLTRMVLGDPENPKSVYCKGGRFAYDDQREVPDVQAITYDYEQLSS